jgi:gluconokinase
MLGVSEKGEAMTPLVTYADTRSAGEAAALRAELDEELFHQRTGCRFHPSYQPAQLRWLMKHTPELFQRVARWVSLGEYMAKELLGEGATSLSVASWSGLLDREARTWDRELLAALHMDVDRLARLSDFDRPQQGLQPEYGRRWPQLAEVPWFPLVGDGAAANVGTGCVSPSQVALTMGTSTALRAVVDGPVPHLPAGLWCYRVDARRSLPGGALTEGGNIYAFMRQTLQLPHPAAVEAALASAVPAGHGLTVLPFLLGERAPGWAGHARGTVHGVSLATQPMDILQASLEAVAYRIALVYAELQQVLPARPQVVAGGGALRSSPAWLQIIADVLGHPVVLSAVEEPSARGAALLGLEALGVLADIGQAPHPMDHVVAPDPVRHVRYREAMARQRALYDALI